MQEVIQTQALCLCLCVCITFFAYTEQGWSGTKERLLSDSKIDQLS
jgi:hypothetical protein